MPVSVHRGFLLDTDLQKEVEMINLNITALTYLTKIYAKEMKLRGCGKIMNVSSTAAFQPGPLMAVYYATKAYVQSFSEALANELKGTGVTVTTLCPGPTASGFQSAANINNVRLVKGRKLPSSAEVALFGYNAMMKEKIVAVHGFINKIVAQSYRFFAKEINYFGGQKNSGNALIRCWWLLGQILMCVLCQNYKVIV